MNAKNIPSSELLERQKPQNRNVLSYVSESERSRIFELLQSAELRLPTREEIEHFIQKKFVPNERRGLYRPRSNRDMLKLFDNYHVLKSGDESLGGISLFPHEDNVELGTIWSVRDGCDISKKIVEMAVEQEDIKSQRLMALTNSIRSSFLQAGFVSRGYVSENTEMPDMPEFIRKYDLTTRMQDPEIFELDRRSMERNEHDTADHEQNGQGESW